MNLPHPRVPAPRPRVPESECPARGDLHSFGERLKRYGLPAWMTSGGKGTVFRNSYEHAIYPPVHHGHGTSSSLGGASGVPGLVPIEHVHTVMDLTGERERELDRVRRAGITLNPYGDSRYMPVAGTGPSI